MKKWKIQKAIYDHKGNQKNIFIYFADIKIISIIIYFKKLI